jgi:hypothetical protein
MKKVLFRIWQWTWGFPQTLIGAILYCIHKNQPHSQFHGCVVTYWDLQGSLGVGMFLFIDKGHYAQTPQILVHEFGHAVQSAILGPLFLPIMGIPSFLWCNLSPCRKLRREKGVSYYSFYPEHTANRLGAWATGETCSLK